MAVVDDVTVASLGLAAPAGQGQRQALADEAFQPIVVETHPHAKADQPRRHGVKYLAQHEAAARGHEHRGLIIVGGSSRWQRPQRGALQLHHLAAAGVAPADQVGDPGPIDIEALEIDAATKQQSLGHTALEMSVLTFDGAVLVRHPGVVAGRRHLVVRAQRLVATRLVDPGIVIEIAERRRQTVRPVLDRHAAE